MLLEDIKLTEARLARGSYVNAIKQTILDIQAGKIDKMSKPLDNQEHHDELLNELTEEFGDPLCNYETDGSDCWWGFPSNIRDQEIFVTVGMRGTGDGQDTFYVNIDLWN